MRLPRPLQRQRTPSQDAPVTSAEPDAVRLCTPQVVVVEAQATVHDEQGERQVTAALVVPRHACVDGRPTEAVLRRLAREWIQHWQQRFGQHRVVLRLRTWWAGRWLRLA